MKSKNYFINGSRIAWSAFNLNIKSVISVTLLLVCIQMSLHAQQTQFIKPSWWFGATSGVNINFYRGSTQNINSGLTIPTAFHDGQGVGLFLAPLVEYTPFNSRLGITLQVGYDNRRGKFQQIITPCNCPADLSTNLSYFSIEPSLRLAPFKSSFYMFIGPRFAINTEKSSTYDLGTNPDFPEQVDEPSVTGDFSNVNKSLISMQIGAGFDIPLSPKSSRFKTVLSPFISFQPYFGQDPRSVETCNITTLRAGAAIKFGCGRRISSTPVTEYLGSNKLYRFTVISPQNIPGERRIRETFPLLNYVFFDVGSTEIPDRYVIISKSKVNDFKEDQLEQFKPLKLSERSSREMIVYYNILNILGDRLGKYPNSSITLVGSSENGPQEGRIMANSVKNYLVDIFGIKDSRIAIEGRDKPKIPSEQPGAVLDLNLLHQGDRRVSIESSSPDLLMEFQSGPDAPLRPVALISNQDAPLDSYVSFNVDAGDESFSSWLLEIADEEGSVKQFGPYVREKVSLPGKSILGSKAEGTYNVRMIGNTKTGNIVRIDTSVHMKLWTPALNQDGVRFSIIYGFDNSKAIDIYKDYLTKVITPMIPVDGTLMIHGYTDIIGEESYNQKLSLARANDVWGIMKNALRVADRNDVKYMIYGFGEDPDYLPFENNYPEERFYNRTVLIDIITRK